MIAFSLTTLLINHSIFSDWSAFKVGLSYEINHVLTKHFGGTEMSRPNSFAIGALFRETMPHVLVLAGAFLISLVVFWKTVTRWEVFLVLFAVGFSVLLAFSVIPECRYNLPVVALLHLMAALVILKCAAFLKRPLNWFVLLAFLLTSLISAQLLHRARSQA